MIQIQGASKSFKGTPAVQNLTLHVEHGEILGLLGANGAGKSTTTNMLLGFIKPDSGSVQIKGLSTADKAQEVRNFVGFIPENVSLYPYLSGLENLDYFCRLTGLKYSKSELQNFLSTCGLQKEDQYKKVAEYSKGMRQKVGIDGHNPADERGKKLEQETLQEYGVDSLSQLPINFDGLRMQADEEYGNQVWDKHFGELRKVLAQQKQSYQLAGVFNPFISLQNASMGFTASDNLHHQEFLVQVENYRRGFIKSLNEKHAFGGSKTGDWGWKADNEFFKSVPDYNYQPMALATVFSNYLPDLILLMGWAVLVTLLLFYATKKMQIV